MLSYRKLTNGFGQKGIKTAQAVLGKASLSAFFGIHGKVQAMPGALLAHFQRFWMSGFSYKIMQRREPAPTNNGIGYGARQHLNNGIKLLIDLRALQFGTNLLTARLGEELGGGENGI